MHVYVQGHCGPHVILLTLHVSAGEATYLPIFTGFIGRGAKTGAVTTLGRGGSDLTATVLGAALGLREVQVSALALLVLH